MVLRVTTFYEDSNNEYRTSIFVIQYTVKLIRHFKLALMGFIPRHQSARAIGRRADHKGRCYIFCRKCKNNFAKNLFICRGNS